METDVVHNPDQARYEVWADGKLAGFVQYRPREGALNLFHTEIDGAYDGQGLGSTLARGALDDLRAQHLAVVRSCPFIAGYIRRHPEYEDRVAPGESAG